MGRGVIRRRDRRKAKEWEGVPALAAVRLPAGSAKRGVVAADFDVVVDWIVDESGSVDLVGPG